MAIQEYHNRVQHIVLCRCRQINWKKLFFSSFSAGVRNSVLRSIYLLTFSTINEYQMDGEWKNNNFKSEPTDTFFHLGHISLSMKCTAIGENRQRMSEQPARKPSFISSVAHRF